MYKNNTLLERMCSKTISVKYANFNILRFFLNQLLIINNVFIVKTCSEIINIKDTNCNMQCVITFIYNLCY